MALILMSSLLHHGARLLLAPSAINCLISTPCWSLFFLKSFSISNVQVILTSDFKSIAHSMALLGIHVPLGPKQMCVQSSRWIHRYHELEADLPLALPKAYSHTRWVKQAQGGKFASHLSGTQSASQGTVAFSVVATISGVARTRPMPGHSVGTLRLRVASYPGPAQL